MFRQYQQRLMKAICVALAIGLSLTACGGGETAPDQQAATVGGAAPAQQVAIVTAAQVAGNNSVRLSVKSWDWSQNKDMPILAAIVQVDGTNYSVDTNGDAWVVGVDAGLHDVHVFADGYTWLSVYGYTADVAGNTFHLDDITIAKNYNAGLDATMHYIPLAITLPVGTTYPQWGNIELKFTSTVGSANTWVGVNSSNIELGMYASITPYANVTGVITATRTSCDMYGYNCMQTSFADIANVTLATAPAWNTAAATAITLSDTAVPQTPKAVASNEVEVRLAVNLRNSALSAANVIDGYTSVSGDFVWSDTNGNQHTAWVHVSPSSTTTFDTYSNAWISTVNAGAVRASIDYWGAALVPGSTVTGVLTFKEMVYDSLTQKATVTNLVDMGLQSFTVSTAPYIPTVNLLPASATLDVTFPVVPPTPVTLLAVQSVTVPVAMQLSEIQLYDAHGFIESIIPNRNGLVLPYTFSSILGSSGLPLQVDASAYDPYSGYDWYIHEIHPLGATVNLLPALTVLPSISPYQQGKVINYDFGGVNTEATVGLIRLENNATGGFWQLFTAPQNSAVTLPTVPTGITSPWLAGSVYALRFEVGVWESLTYSGLLQAAFSDPTVQLSINRETLGSSVPYTY